MGYTTLQLCSNGGAFEAVPRPRVVVNLADARAKLAAHGVEVVDARVMLIARMSREVTLGRDGRVVIKTRDPAEAKRVFDELAKVIGLPRDP
jgi:hypothetical protein